MSNTARQYGDSSKKLPTTIQLFLRYLNEFRLVFGFRFSVALSEGLGLVRFSIPLDTI